MKKSHLKILAIAISVIYLLISFSMDIQAQRKKQNNYQCYDTLLINFSKEKANIDLKFIMGESHNHPTFAVWIENEEGSYIETLFVTEYISCFWLSAKG